MSCSVVSGIGELVGLLLILQASMASPIRPSLLDSDLTLLVLSCSSLAIVGCSASSVECP